MTDFINWFTRFYAAYGILGLLVLCAVLVFGYFLKSLVDLIMFKIRTGILKKEPKPSQEKGTRWNDNLMKETSKKSEDQYMSKAKESFVLRMDTCIADSMSRLRPACKLKGAVFCHLLRIKMEENKKVGLDLLENYKEHKDKSPMDMTEMIVSKLHVAFNKLDDIARRDGIHPEIISRFLNQCRLSEDILNAVAKRICLIELFESNAKRTVAVAEIIATLTILNIVDYQETARSFNGKAKKMLKEYIDNDPNSKMRPWYRNAIDNGCVYDKEVECKSCDGE
jgi:hypothetical protein